MKKNDDDINEWDWPWYGDFRFCLFHDSFDSIATFAYDSADKVIVRQNFKRNLSAIRLVGLCLHHFEDPFAGLRTVVRIAVYGDHLL